MQHYQNTGLNIGEGPGVSPGQEGGISGLGPFVPILPNQTLERIKYDYSLIPVGGRLAQFRDSWTSPPNDNWTVNIQFSLWSRRPTATGEPFWT